MPYDEALIPLFTSVQRGQPWQPGESNPWAAWPYQQTFATAMYGTGQYGFQYSPGASSSPSLPMRQPGTWPLHFPPGVLGTMQSSIAELSYMQDPSLVPRLSQLYGVQVPQLLPAASPQLPEQNMQPNFAARRATVLRSGAFPVHRPIPPPPPKEKPKGPPPPDRLPPPMCGPGQRILQTAPGVWRCVPFYQGDCPPGYEVVGYANGAYVCRFKAGQIRNPWVAARTRRPPVVAPTRAVAAIPVSPQDKWDACYQRCQHTSNPELCVEVACDPLIAGLPPQKPPPPPPPPRRPNPAIAARTRRPPVAAPTRAVAGAPTIPVKREKTCSERCHSAYPDDFVDWQNCVDYCQRRAAAWVRWPGSPWPNPACTSNVDCRPGQFCIAGQCVSDIRDPFPKSRARARRGLATGRGMKTRPRTGRPRRFLNSIGTLMLASIIGRAVRGAVR